MQLSEYQEKLKLSYENNFINESIYELVELFYDLTNLNTISYYKYEYEYNDYFHKFDISSNSSNNATNSKRNFKIILKDKKTIYGYLLINQRIKSNPVLKKLLNKIKKYLKKEKDVQKQSLEFSSHAIEHLADSILEDKKVVKATREIPFDPTTGSPEFDINKE